MYNPLTNSFDFSNALLWVDFVVALLVLVGFGVLVVFLFKRKITYIIYSVNAFVTLVAWFFGLKLIMYLSLVMLSVALVTFFSVNVASIRPYISDSLAGKNISFRKNSEKIFDRHALYLKIESAVIALSKSRTGAIITFERNVELSDFVKSGTILNSPVTPELLLTIFYPGTRLHDGAVVIKRDFILAASVYYTPTTKPLTGKYGSRHRAAIGISEITDSVTVVVSEETGRISLAVAGELIPVNNEKFLRTFEEYMFEEDNKAKKEN